MPTAVYRFTRDLRLDDHAGLSAAAAHGNIVPLLIIDPEIEQRLRSSPRRAAFYCHAAGALDRALQERGSKLIVRRGQPAHILRRICTEFSFEAVVWSASYDAAGIQSDTQLQSALEEAGLRATIVHDAPAIPPDESTAARSSGSQGYRAFAPYHAVWRHLTPSSYEGPLLQSFGGRDVQGQALPVPRDFGADDQPAGQPARAKLDAFLRTGALQYAFAHNVPSDDRTSHLSADLSFGTIAARTVVRETLLRLDDPFLLAEERASLRLFLRSIALRDFFLQLAWYNPRTFEYPLQEKMRAFAFAQEHPALAAWREGRTGYPLVDAGIRQLRAIGWMHPRVRAIAASFLCFDLGVDWRIGLAEWETQLIEDDPALAVGNWQWIAGVGADLAAYPRIYNPLKQARRFDPAGAYARRWIAEFAHAPGAITPRKTTSQMELGLGAAQKYPKPVVEHERAARAFLARYQQFVKQADGRPANR